MKFWKRSGSSASSSGVKRSGSTNSLSSSLNSNNNGNGIHRSTLSKKPSSGGCGNYTPSEMPTRKQRMQLLKCIIHHADAVQKQYLVQKQLPSVSDSKVDNSSSIFDTFKSDTTAAEINDKCYQRWHQVLQEGLVPQSVHALSLLQKSAASNGEEIDEEEVYFSSMEGMEEEIQVMAILARAAAFNAISTNPENDTKKADETTQKSNDTESDGMEQINAMMKCTAMLLFHIVLVSSSSSTTDDDEQNNVQSSPKESSKNNKEDSEASSTTVAGYDGRVRHVMKLACVDILTRAIVDSVDAYETKSNVNTISTTEEEGQVSGEPIDIDEYSLWNIANIKSFLDVNDLGQDAIFGTPFKQQPSTTANSGMKLLEGGGGSSSADTKEGNTNTPSKRLSQASSSGNLSEQSQSEVADNNNASTSTMQEDNVSDEEVESICSIGSSQSSSSSLEVLEEEAKEVEPQSAENNPQTGEEGLGEGKGDERNESDHTDTGQDSIAQDEGDIAQSGNDHSEEVKSADQDAAAKEEQAEEELLKELGAKRHFNAKFLATRKFELIERLVAIDIVRFLMALEREKKLRDQEMNNPKNKPIIKEPIIKEKQVSKPSTLFDDVQDGPKSSEDGTLDANEEDNAEEKSDQEADASSSQYFTASRIKQIKRSAKIAGAGLALGTVFAITGGLAAPALAAGIGGIAALTGATTASSTALLAVLATFKAGAALFGVGGGGLAAYKMKKRTAGLTEFTIRRENIDQYMYAGASEEQMKKGIEQMLPQLHTTVAVAGWLRENDVADFQLAWGIQPTCTYAKVDDERKIRIRQMKRFYAVYNPPLVHLCEHFMETLQRRQKKDFSWDRIWQQLENKYGSNPDHILPIDAPHENEVYLSYEEKEMIDGVLNDAKIVNMRKLGFESGEDIDFNNDEIEELLASVTPKKKGRTTTADSETELELDENELVKAMENDLALVGCDSEAQIDSEAQGYGEGQIQKQQQDQVDEKKNEPESESDNIAFGLSNLTVNIPSGDADDVEAKSPTLQERMATQREQQVSFLKEKGLIDNESDVNEGAGSPKMVSADATHSSEAQDPPPRNDQMQEYYDDERCPIVWDWQRVYGTTDLHTVTWESKMLSSLCHIVENMALEVSSQATKVALQYSVIGAIIAAVAIPSALVTASKLIDDPYQIVVIRADEAGKELARCLLQSDERRPVTLVGFSFGARVIYSCLRELARQQDLWEENRDPKSNSTAEESKTKRSSSFLKKKSQDERRFMYDREPASLVGDVVFIGLPRAIDRNVLTSVRRVTGGRLVNCYTTNDWLLSLMFIARGGTPCGVRAIKDVPGVENYNVTDLVESHTKYGDAIPNILQRVRFSEP